MRLGENSKELLPLFLRLWWRSDLRHAWIIVHTAKQKSIVMFAVFLRYCSISYSLGRCGFFDSTPEPTSCERTQT
jgi:hypothetical protein